MYCKDCKFREIFPDDLLSICTSESIREWSIYDNGGTYNKDGSRLLYCYEESGRFYVEDYFGCVHFEPHNTATWKDLANQAELFQKRVSGIEFMLRNIRDKCKHPNFPVRQLGDQYMDVCPDCGYISYSYSI